MNKLEKRCKIGGKIVFDTEVESEKINSQLFVEIAGSTIASTPVTKNGKFNIEFERKGEIPEINIILGPPVKVFKLTPSNTKKITISPEEWKKSGDSLVLDLDIKVGSDLVICFLPKTIKLCGIVCKEMLIEGTTKKRCCPVPHAKVELFDVDPGFMKPIMDSFPISEKLAIKEEGTVGRIKVDKSDIFRPYYLKDKITETFTNACGEFCVSFDWYPGCVRPDFSPDLIFKVSQTFNDPTSPDADSNGNVTYSLISEGYFDTRWDIPDYHWVKLDVPNSNMFVSCNPNCHPLLEKRALIMGVGSQSIYDHIKQETTLTEDCGYVYHGSFIRSPFGEFIDIMGRFGSKVEETGERFYRVSYAKVDNCETIPSENDWKPITQPLSEEFHHWDKGTGALKKDSKNMGPFNLPNQPNCEFYQVKDLRDENNNEIFWHSNRIAILDTPKLLDGLYILKIEVFDSKGNIDPETMIGDDEGNYEHMYININNIKPDVKIRDVLLNNSPINDCGSFEYQKNDNLKFLIDAHHDNKHLHHWNLSFQIGKNGPHGNISSGEQDIKVDKGAFEGLNNQEVIWKDFEKEIVACDVFGVSVQLFAQSNIINGYTFLGPTYPHGKSDFVGLAVSKKK